MSAKQTFKHTEVRRLSDHIAAAAKEMGLTAWTDRSKVSASTYVYVSDNSDADPVKVRCSDHDDRYGGSDLHIFDGQCPAGVIGKVAARFGRTVPSKYTAEAYAARSASATQAATAKKAQNFASEQEMIAAVVSNMQGHKMISAVAAGKVVDAMFPGIARAQRQRIAGDASYRLNKARKAA